MIPQGPPVLRYIISRGAPNIRHGQRRWAQVHDVRFLATHRQPDRISEKYREKLQEKAKAYSFLSAPACDELILGKPSSQGCRRVENSLQRPNTSAKEVRLHTILKFKLPIPTTASPSTSNTRNTANSNSNSKSHPRQILITARHQAPLVLHRRSQNPRTPPKRNRIHLAPPPRLRPALAMRHHPPNSLLPHRSYRQATSTIHPSPAKRRARRGDTFPTVDFPNTHHRHCAIHASGGVQVEGGIQPAAYHCYAPLGSRRA